jgi:hypothetical protein
MNNDEIGWASPGSQGALSGLCPQALSSTARPITLKSFPIIAQHHLAYGLR